MVQLSSFSKCLAVLTVLMSTLDARRHLDGSIGNKRRPVKHHANEVEAAVGSEYSPLVQGTDCETMCLFEDTYNKFCWKF